MLFMALTSQDLEPPQKRGAYVDAPCMPSFYVMTV
jgi:hypothetical protein